MKQTLSLNGHCHLFLFMLSKTAFAPTLHSHCEDCQDSHVECDGRVLCSLFSFCGALSLV